MTYTNSPLVTYKDLSPNYNVRRATDSLSRITIHHFAGCYDVKKCGELFHVKQGSSNYGIDPNNIALFVEEKNRAWTSSDGTNDYRAITIECANTPQGVQFETWEIDDRTYVNLIALCVDICRRYGKTKVIEISDQIENLGWKSATERVTKQTAYANNYVVPDDTMLLTQHIYFATTTCPGPYIRGKWKNICADINSQLNGQPYVPPAPQKDVAKPTLRKGNRGTQVKLLQNNLLSLGYKLPRYGADGDFGDETRSAVIAFQKNAFPNMPKEWDGIYGNKTYAKLKESIN